MPILVIMFFIKLAILRLAILLYSFLFADFGSPERHNTGCCHFVLRLSLPVVLDVTEIGISIDNVSARGVPGSEQLVFIYGRRRSFSPVVVLSIFGKCGVNFVNGGSVVGGVPLITGTVRGLCYLFVSHRGSHRTTGAVVRTVGFVGASGTSVKIFPRKCADGDYRLLPFEGNIFGVTLGAGTPVIIYTVGGAERVPGGVYQGAARVGLGVRSVVCPRGCGNVGATRLSGVMRRGVRGTFGRVGWGWVGFGRRLRGSFRNILL